MSHVCAPAFFLQGFHVDRAYHALTMFGNDRDAALDWMLEHGEEDVSSSSPVPAVRGAHRPAAGACWM